MREEQTTARAVTACGLAKYVLRLRLATKYSTVVPSEPNVAAWSKDMDSCFMHYILQPHPQPTEFLSSCAAA